MKTLLQLTVFAMIATLLAGCARSGPSPEASFKKMYKSLAAYDRTGYQGYQDDAFALLSDASRNVLEQQAAAINKTLPEGVQSISAAQLLLVRKLPMGDTVVKTKTVEQRADRVLLAVTYSGGEGSAVLVRKGEKWGVDLWPSL